MDWAAVPGNESRTKKNRKVVETHMKPKRCSVLLFFWLCRACDRLSEERKWRSRTLFQRTRTEKNVHSNERR
jgi:hypothetical protein